MNLNKLNRILRWMLVTSLWLAVTSASKGSELGPIFPLQGGTQLATRPDGTALTADAFNTVVTNGVALREIYDSQISPGGTNQSPYQGYYSYGDPSFFYASPDVAACATNAVIVYVHKVAYEIGETDEYLIEFFLADTNGSPASSVMVAGSPESWLDGTVVPRVAMNRAGQFAAVWPDQFNLANNGYSFVRGKIFNANGQPIGTNSYFTLNQVLSFASDSAAVALAEDGTSVYTWARPDSTGSSIYARQVDAVGVPIASEFRVNSSINGNHGDSEIAINTNGSFVVAWTQSGSDANGVYLQRFSAAGIPLGAELRVARNAADPQVAMVADGRFVVAWRGEDGNGNGVFAQRFLADGTNYGTELWVNEGATNSQTKPLLGMADDGTFIVKWSEGATNFARWVSWDATNQTRILGPWIQSMTPASSAAAPFTNVTVTFDRLMNAATFTSTDVQLIDPVGRIVPITSIQTTDNQNFKLNFAPQYLRGPYQMKIGPNINDADGALMDQNGNAIKGEATDAFQVAITVMPPTVAPTPFLENFEAGSIDALGSHWSFSTTDGGTVEVVSKTPAVSGTKSLRMNYGGETAILTVNLAGATNATLDFWALQSTLYSVLGPAEVSISQNGTNWYLVASPSSDPKETWRHYSVNLDTAIQASGIQYDADFHIRFVHLNGYYQVPQVWYWDDIRVSFNNDVFGSRVISQSPTGSLAGAVASCNVTFNEDIAASSFTNADVQIVGPAGNVISLNTNSPVVDSGDHRTFTLNFATPQTLAGLYSINVGPHVTDIAGNEMDQNGDGASLDSYSGTFQLLSGSVTPPVMENFEAGSIDALGSHWSFSTSSGGTTQVVPATPPASGAYSLRMNYGGEKATLTVNLAGATNATLDFWARQTTLYSIFGNAEVSISQNGTNWYLVASPSSTAAIGSWRHFSVNLDTAIQASGIQYDADFHIRFVHLDGDYFSPQVWYWDDIRVLVGNGNALSLTSVSSTPNGQFQFQLGGPVGRDFIIQASTNLANWIPIATNIIPGSGYIPFTDSSATNYNQRFYRAKLQ